MRASMATRRHCRRPSPRILMYKVMAHLALTCPRSSGSHSLRLFSHSRLKLDDHGLPGLMNDS